MDIQDNAELADYSTMGLGGQARFLAHVFNKEELVEALHFAKSQGVPSIIIGGGSNIFWQDGTYNGLVIVSDIKNFQINWQNETEALINIGSGEEWDNVVDRCVEAGLTGIEGLSLIPGKAGATPVQNVGAYGQEISNSLVDVEAYDSHKEEFISIKNEDCGFGYRTSRFKTNDHGRFYIVSINLRLFKGNPKPPFYPVLARYLEEHGTSEYTPKVIRNAVIDIRSAKLPDPKKVHNNGSFFANPVVSKDKYAQLLQKYPNMPGWPSGDDLIKLSAAWLIEQAGLKDFHDEATGMSTWARQPLVLVNEHAKTTKDLLIFKDKIVKTIKEKFEVELAQEPELLP